MWRVYLIGAGLLLALVLLLAGAAALAVDAWRRDDEPPE